MRTPSKLGKSFAFSAAIAKGFNDSIIFQAGAVFSINKKVARLALSAAIIKMEMFPFNQFLLFPYKDRLTNS
jgi:hypothetical protein